MVVQKNLFDMRFEFNYEIGDQHEESFECYFPEFDAIVDIPNDYYDVMLEGNSFYMNGRKDQERKDVFDAKMAEFKFKVIRPEGVRFDKPIAFFDLETTGVDLVKDQIVQIAVTKIYPNGERDVKVRYVKPTIPIPAEATEVHGIDAKTVKNAPAFREIAKSLRAFLDGCDIGGYNSTQFDSPLLQEEFHRAGIHDWPAPGTRFVDVMHLYYHFNPRTLEAAYKDYCGESLEGAHDAGVDTTAAVDILQAMVERHEELPKDMQGLHEFCNEGRVDLAGKLIRNEKGEVVYNFGKDKGKPVKNFPGFGEWMLKKGSFTENTRACVRELLNEPLT